MSYQCATDRYASEEMQNLFSYRYRAKLWRKLWIYLAEAQKELGLDVTDEQIRQMKNHVDDISLERIEELEQETRHEVMAHLRAFAEQCPKAEPILHMGATSMFLMDNADLIRTRAALQRIQKLLIGIVQSLSEFCEAHRDEPIVGMTHLQTAQVTTVGKRASLWLSDFLTDFRQVRNFSDRIPFRSIKGAVGTQSSFLELFDGDHEKVRQLEQKIREKAGFSETFPVTGQTYSRKFDSRLLHRLSEVAQSASKYAVDLRLLQSRGELQEPTGSSQVGSSAMPHKVNPIRTERITGLSRFVMELPGNTSHTAANQWLERSLDDSSNRRFSLSHAFLVTDGLLKTVLNCVRGMTVRTETIQKHLKQERPHLLSEYLLMQIVKNGGSRQKFHERLREHAREIHDQPEEQNRTFLELVRNDEEITSVLDDIPNPDWIQLAGRAPQQVQNFLDEEVRPELEDESLPDLDASLQI